MPAPTTTESFLELARKSGLLTAAAAADLTAGPPLPANPNRAAAALVKTGLLTAFQAKQLLSGKHRGFLIGQYKVLDQVGVGGMGAVYLAEHASLRRRVALKVLTGLTGGDKDRLVLGRFLREARAAAALDHPNIVKLFDVGKQGNVHFLVMEFVDGRTFDQAVKAAGPLPPGRAAEFVAQAAAGLQHAHERGFVHRDVKPANLMVHRDGVVKILDMGLTRSGAEDDKLTELLDKGAVIGTADYLAPEMALGHPAEPAADLYSLGATAYFLLTGRPPFEGSPTQKLMAHQNSRPVPVDQRRPDVPAGLAAVVDRLLAKKPADRFPTAADVAAALSPFLSAAASGRVAVAVAATGAGQLPGPEPVGSSVVRVPAAVPSALSDTMAATGQRTAGGGSSRSDRLVRPAADSSPPAASGRLPKPAVLAVAAAGLLAAGLGIGWVAVAATRPAVTPSTAVVER